MITMVCFRTGNASYCMPVEATRAVRATTGMIALPDPARDVAGLIPGQPPLTVISPLGTAGSHVLVVQTDGASAKRFGLLVDQVIGLRRIDEDDIRSAPEGQARLFVSGTVESDGELMLIADPYALATHL
jgi:chemotaxis signal transduction protein